MAGPGAGPESLPPQWHIFADFVRRALQAAATKSSRAGTAWDRYRRESWRRASNQARSGKIVFKR